METPYTFVTILTVTYPHELAVIRGKLESEGIECFTLNENRVSANPLYSNAIGGVRLQVSAADEVRARGIVQEGYYIRPQPKTEETHLQPGMKTEALHCPQCGSAEITRSRLSPAVFAISILLVGFPLPFLQRAYHCFDCGLDFKKGAMTEDCISCNSPTKSL